MRLDAAPMIPARRSLCEARVPVRRERTPRERVVLIPQRLPAATAGGDGDNELWASLR